MKLYLANVSLAFEYKVLISLLSLQISIADIFIGNKNDFHLDDLDLQPVSPAKTPQNEKVKHQIPKVKFDFHFIFLKKEFEIVTALF